MEKIVIINEDENLSENLETNLDSEEQLIETVKESLQRRDNYIVSRKENISSTKETKKKKWVHITQTHVFIYIGHQCGVLVKHQI